LVNLVAITPLLFKLTYEVALPFVKPKFNNGIVVKGVKIPACTA
jgi:hypothetical protein